MNEITAEKWLKALAAAQQDSAPPEGSITMHEFAALIGKRHTVARNRMRNLIAAGAVKKVVCSVTAEDGRVVIKPFYLPTDTVAKKELAKSAKKT